MKKKIQMNIDQAVNIARKIMKMRKKNTKKNMKLWLFCYNRLIFNIYDEETIKGQK